MIKIEILDSGRKTGILAYEDNKYFFTYDEKFLKELQCKKLKMIR